MKVITVAVQKGGTGKTTTAAILAQAAAYKGKKVLVIDLDPQGNLTLAFNAANNNYTSYDLITNGTDKEPIITKTSCSVDIIPAARELSALKIYKGSARRLQNAIEPLKKNYDLIFIDTPPTAAELQYNALQAATDLIIPVQADIYSLQSLYQVIDTAIQIQQSNKELKITGFIITRYDNRSTLSKTMKDNIIRAANKNNVAYLGSVRNGIAVQEAAALQQSLYEYAPKSKPAADYLEVLEMLY